MNGILHIPRFHTAIAEWLFCIIFIIFSKKRVKGLNLYLIIFTYLGTFIGYQYVAGLLPLGLWIPGMVGAVLLMFSFVYFTTKLGGNTSGYITIQSFIIAEFAASLEWQIYHYLISTYPSLINSLLEYSIMTLIYSGAFYVLYLFESRYKAKGFKLITGNNELISALAMGIIIFTMSNLSFISIDSSLTDKRVNDIFYIRTVVDFAGVVLFYSLREHKLSIHVSGENKELERIINKQYANYKQSLESMDLINRKYHDLKHQLEVIRTEENPEQKAKYLDELEQGIAYYDTQYKTGNKVLDTILTSKSMQMIDHDINFTCVVDGQLIDFISVMDICSIFGNAIDNSIESVKKIDKDKRLIKLAVFKQKDLLLIRFENYYTEELRYEDGNYLTTKTNKSGHGYGLKSIKAIVQKYNGSVKINTQNNWFTLLILIPIP